MHYSIDDLESGLVAMTSLIHKSEQAFLSLKKGSSQWTLLERRMKAFVMAKDLLEEKLHDMKEKDNQSGI
ncbi:MAG: hypothetical protein CVV63_01075 [Tenericutes bacterium HGW-Tenericutes-8]|nr:MAG: hypothetical protein CVV63_01075 [Tenericutes bacterium HGW-Tenericutes-8]